MSNLFPMFLKLAGRQVLVIGAGQVGEGKIAGILDTGARIRVVARDASATVRDWARAGQIELELRSFSAQDLDGAFIAVVATGSRDLNEFIYR
ncbi:MAG: NAD(P)-dependent oxidoreductase, partial [Candidatus Sulfotelmatobacter sp.]